MPGPTNEEQLMLELINRLRINPAGEYAALTSPSVLAEYQGALTFFGVSLSAFQTAMASRTAVAPLAWNENLASAAQTHSAAMIAADTQSHQLPGEPGLGTRATNAGYTGWTALSENIYAYSNSVTYGHAGFVIDWGYDTEDFETGTTTLRSNWQSLGDGMQDPPGHRNNLLSASYREIGIDVTAESNSGTGVGPLVITQDLGSRSGYQAQFLGVVINDTDNDNFYDIGEGMGGITVTLIGVSNTYTTTTWASGGWQIAVPAGTYTIRFTGGSLSGTIEVSRTLGTANLKVDVEAADAVSPFNPVNGTGNPETLWGTVGADRIDALGGADILYGLNGADELLGGPGDDYLDGGFEIDAMSGGTGGDFYVVLESGDTITEIAGEGYDVVYAYVGYTLPVNTEVLVLRDGVTQGTGNAGPNSIFGNTGGDTLSGLGDNDSLYGIAGDDTLYGGEGNDWVDGGFGLDTMHGGPGDDTYIVVETGDVVVEAANEGHDIVLTYADFTLPANVEQMIMRDNARIGTGNAGPNNIAGSQSADTLSGLDGDDQLFGGNGEDILLGGPGDDRLYGGLAKDTMTGGTGIDLFSFIATNETAGQAPFSDVITDFNPAEFDRIDLSQIDANVANGAGTNETFTWIDTAAFSNVAGQLRYEQVSGQTHVGGDVNGDGFADFTIVLTGTITLSGSSFFL